MARSSALRASALVVVTVICATLMPGATAQNGCGCTAVGVATYRMTFTSTWTSPTPPSSNPHWSQPVGTSHGACYSMWRPGALASAGIKIMAELGGTSTLITEFNTNRPNTLGAGFTAGGLGVSGSSSATFTVDRYHSLVSATTMIAPSPDWFAGVYDVDLCNSSTWIASATYNLDLWDSGTDSGLTWGAVNSATSPAELIAMLTPNSTRATSLGYAIGTSAYRLGTMKFDMTGVNVAGAVTNPNCATCPTVPPPTTMAASGSTVAPPTTTPATTAAPSTAPVTIPASCGCSAVGVATYRMTFSSIWTSPTPPSSSPHWSSPVGTSHSACYSMWKPGGLASAGIRWMAELGGTSTLITEYNRNRPNTLSSFTSSGTGVSGSSSTTFTVDRYHSLVSATTMIAPSPDWFAGVYDVNLCNGANWVTDHTYTLDLWDAGTDSGLTWTASNAMTSPAQPIALLTPDSDRATSLGYAPGTTSYRLATMTFTRTGVNAAGAVTNPNCVRCPSMGPTTSSVANVTNPNCAKCPAVPAPNTTPQQQHSTTTPQPTTMAASAAEESSNVAYGPIVGGVVGGVACLVLVVLAVIITLYLLRREKQPVKRNAEKLISSKELDMECK